MKRNLIYIALAIVIFACNVKPNITVAPDNEQIKYVGRIDFGDPLSPEIYWSASEIEIEFTGTSVSATFDDENGENYFNIVIDKDSVYPLKLEQGSKTYLLANNLDKDKAHTLEVIKRNEFDKGKTAFKGFYIESGELLDTKENSGRLIEFFGNSITAGFAIEDTTGGDSPRGTFTNCYASYASLTSRYFNADMHATIRSGIGITVSWHEFIMPEIYNRLNPFDSTSIWDFKRATPDLVVINLMQNDSWIVHLIDNKQHIRRFGDNPPNGKEITQAYADFVKSIRKEYPQTPIICALGSMDAVKEGSEWPGYVKTAVQSLNDDNLYMHFFEFINKEGHPRVDDNQKMAEGFISFIEDNLAWEK